MPSPFPPSAPSPSYAPSSAPGRSALLVALLVPAVVAFALWAFAWPAARTAPDGLPVGVAGPAAAAERVAGQLRAQDGAFEVRVYEDEAAARGAIEDREVYGAFLVGRGESSEVLTASAGGASVAQLLADLGARQAPEGARVTVTDVVPAPAADPRGAAFTSAVLPLALAGIATGAAATALGLRRGRALLTLIGAAALTGAVGAAIAQGWLDVLGGTWLAVAAVLALVVAAGAATVAGAAARLGPAGLGVGSLVVMLLGNPWSGAGSAPEMLPEPVGTLGAWLPTGAGATLLRSVAFFDGAAVAQPLAVLLAWTALGTAALLFPRRRT
ncbi:hypothetical protein, partial [Streptomyces sp. SBT349]|uniref:hypothetical protein n=1 Tax=Streptomyces sp. SBT349 TaxID=1580539 RepID=UPI00069D0142